MDGAAQQLVANENSYRQQMRQAIAMLEEELSRTDLTTDEQEQLRKRLDSLRSKLQQVQLESAKDITLDRIVHLRQIFTHYCTHIFRVGKHMTFQRLEYEKVHMTMDRFFVFLRDFRLTTIEVEGRLKEHVPKGKVMNIFKKVSSNAKDITFEEFIQCLERLAIIHYDESRFATDNKPDSRLAPKKKPVKKTVVPPPQENDQPTEVQQTSLKLDTEEPQQQQQQQQSQQQQQDNVQAQDNKQPAEQPSDPVEAEPDPPHQEEDPKPKSFDVPADSQFQNNEFPPQPSKENHRITEVTALNVPKSEKIEAFYRLIGVDSVRQYRKKLGELNLPMFKSAHTRKASSIQLGQPVPTEPAEPPVSYSNEQQLRMLHIKQRIEQQKLLDIIKRKSPKKPPESESHDYYQMLELRRENRERQKEKISRAKRAKKDLEQEYTRKMNQLPPPPPSKRLLDGPSYKATNVTWDDLERLNFEQVVRKDGSFHPHMLYSLDPDDQQYMGELKFDPNAVQKHRLLTRNVSSKIDLEHSEPHPQRIVSSQLNQYASIRQKRTSSVVNSTKKRAGQLALQQKRKEAATELLVRPKVRSSRQQL